MNWNDTSISLTVSLQNPSAYPLFTDFSPQTFAAAGACPVYPGDGLGFKVTNPQGSGYATTAQPITVSASTTQPF